MIEQAFAPHPDVYPRTIFFEAADAMLILDDDRTVVEANPAACAVFGLSRQAIVDQALEALVVDGAEPVLAAWRELLAFGESTREHQVRSRGGAMRLVECRYRAGVLANRHLCIARDITDRRLVEARLAQSQKMESVGRLAGGIAHDFNNLLTAILGYTEMLLGSRPADDPDRADLEQIQKAGLRAASLTQQLLAFSRKQVLVPKNVDLNQTVTAVTSMLGRLIREDIRLTCEVAPVPAVVRIDPAQIEQVLVNLVLNARDALPAGGEIRIEVARVRRSPADLSPELQLTPLDPVPVDYVRLRVTDNGVGLSPEARAHLFEPFYTTKDVGKGRGLGLASTYGTVRQSNGFIDVESQEGAGTTFTMHFPAIPNAPVRETMTGAAGEVARGRELILLVEDEDAVRVIVSAVLRRSGYRVVEAASPRAAYETFERHGCDIDLLVSDVVMPEMSGPALAQRLVGLRPELRILFISGYSDITTPIDADSPNVSFLRKPFQASALVARVQEMLARPNPVKPPSGSSEA